MSRIFSNFIITKKADSPSIPVSLKKGVMASQGEYAPAFSDSVQKDVIKVETYTYCREPKKFLEH